MIILKIIGVIAIAVLVIIACAAIVLMTHLYKMYNCHECQYCNHYMVYSGTKERGDGNVLLFHCEHCGAWEEVPVSEIVKTL